MTDIRQRAAPDGESDASLNRIERDASIICMVAAVLALPLGGWRAEAPLGVIGGAALMAVAYRAIRGGVDALARRAGPKSQEAMGPRSGRDALSPVQGPGTVASDRAPAPQPGKVPAQTPPESVEGSHATLVWPLTKFILHYGVIAAAAYILLVPLRAHPVGMFVGVSAPVVAIGIEAIRLQRR